MPYKRLCTTQNTTYASEYETELTDNIPNIETEFIAKKYNLPPEIIKSLANCIAIESDFHNWLHGARSCKADQECEWKGLTEDDLIFLAIAYLGIDPKYFEE
jgi:hypothetical protein